jgi:hypothetical protein
MEATKWEQYLVCEERQQDERKQTKGKSKVPLLASASMENNGDSMLVASK